MFGIRQDRLGQQLQREIAVIVQRELKDPRLGFVTITKVELSKDLSHAKVGFSCMGSESERASMQEALDHSAGFIRNLIRKRFHLRIIPELSFRYDHSAEHSIELSEKLDRLARGESLGGQETA